MPKYGQKYDHSSLKFAPPRAKMVFKSYKLVMFCKKFTRTLPNGNLYCWEKSSKISLENAALIFRGPYCRQRPAKLASHSARTI